MREFEGGATRDDDTGKYDFDGFESPLVRHAFAEYMHAHRTQSDGKLRESDNWKKGMGLDVYMKSLCRHFFEANALHHGYVLSTRANTPPNDDIVQALLAVKFNVNGYLHEYLTLTNKVLDIITDVDPSENPMMQLGGHSTEAERKPQTVMEAYERNHMVDMQSRLQRIMDACMEGPTKDPILDRIYDIATGANQLLDAGGSDEED